MMKFKLIATALVTGLGIACSAIPAQAQCAGCGADFNKAERERMARDAREQAQREARERVKENFGTGLIREALDRGDDRVRVYEKASNGDK